MTITAEQKDAIDKSVDEALKRYAKRITDWFKWLGVPSLVVVFGTLIAMLSTLPKSIESSVLATIESDRRVVVDAAALAAQARVAVSEIQEASSRIKNSEEATKLLRSLNQISDGKTVDLVPLLADVSTVAAALRGQKYCVLHIPGVRRDLYAVPIDTAPEVCGRMKEAVYPLAASSNHKDIEVQYGCLAAGELKISNVDGLFRECSVRRDASDGVQRGGNSQQAL